MSALLAALVLFAAAPSPRTPDAGDVAKPSPVAVMPFKNLNGDASLDWLKAGIAETMISDLKKSGRMQVVERDQIDKAMAEMALQGANGTEESSAAKLGKMVGAKTVVLGGFQKAGTQLRITARFVVVETGVVLDTAKATGKMQNIFSLQDEITARLLGQKPPSAVASAKHETDDAKFGAENTLSFVAPRKPATDKTLQAYKLYSMAVTSGSDADRVAYLKQSLQIDPDFTYSTDALDALEKRMSSYEQTHQQSVDQANTDLRAKLASAATDQDRYLAATQLLSADMLGYRYRALLADATNIYGMNIPPYYGQDVRDMAASDVFMAHMMLHETDLALQAGEQYLKQFPNGAQFASVRAQMNNLIEQKRKAETAPADAAKELAELEDSHRDALKRPDHHVADRTYEFGRCTVYQRFALYEDAIRECTAFADHWRGEADDTSKELVFFARWNVVMAKANQGHFDEARALGNQLLADDPEHAREVSMKSQIDYWPRD